MILEEEAKLQTIRTGHNGLGYTTWFEFVGVRGNTIVKADIEMPFEFSKDLYDIVQNGKTVKIIIRY